MKKILAICMGLTAVCAMLHAAPQPEKFGTVDVARIFKTYYKTAQIEGLIKQQSQVFRDYLTRENEKLIDLEKQFNLARDKAQNIALAAAEQQKSQETMKSLAIQIRAKRAEMETYAADRNKYMVKFESDKRAEIMTEITAAVKTEAEKRGCILVFDISGRTFNEVPAIVYANKALDMTTDVVNALNKGQSPKTPAPDTAK